jgi:hypothetical protein
MNGNKIARTMYNPMMFESSATFQVRGPVLQNFALAAALALG